MREKFSNFHTVVGIFPFIGRTIKFSVSYSDGTITLLRKICFEWWRSFYGETYARLSYGFRSLPRNPSRPHGKIWRKNTQFDEKFPKWENCMYLKNILVITNQSRLVILATQCVNFRFFLSFKIYVKSILEANLVLKFSLQKCKIP